jgi:AcrR family transcriptional regulator
MDRAIQIGQDRPIASTEPPETARTRKGRATRARIAAAAAAEIVERGVARTSLEEVKQAAGVSSSQLYHYFADKHALVLAVIDHQTQAILDGQQPLLSSLDSCGRRPRAVADGIHVIPIGTSAHSCLAGERPHDPFGALLERARNLEQPASAIVEGDRE